MAKKIKSRVEYQVNELVNNLTEANTTQSEQSRDYFTAKALYNAKRLNSLVSNAKIGAMALIVAVCMMACGEGTIKMDPNAVTFDSTHIDSANAVVTDSTKAGK